VLEDLVAAAGAYRAAQAAVPAAERAVAEARADVPRAREVLYDEMAAAARAGVRQTDIIKTTGFNREHVRRVLRARGVEAAE
jgi:hypothetical protein